MITSLLTAMTLCAAAPQGAGASFQDGTFAPGTWTMTEFVAGPGTASANTTQLQTGHGNPLPAWRTSHTFAGVGSGGAQTAIWVEHLMNAAVYDPATEGAIAELWFSVDYILPNGQHYVHVLAEQDSKFYVGSWGPGGFVTYSTQSWASFGPNALVQDDFIERLPDGSVNANSHPDFTTTGAPITFGLETSTSTNGTHTLWVDMDNFRVDVNGLSAAATSRPGSPPNPDAFYAVAGDGPVIGTTWQIAVDHQGFLPNADLDAVGYSSSATNVATPFGTLLCGPVAGLVSGPPGQPFSVPVPNDPNLIGQPFCFQAVSADVAQGVALLTNALDVTVGTF